MVKDLPSAGLSLIHLKPHLLRLIRGLWCWFQEQINLSNKAKGSQCSHLHLSMTVMWICGHDWVNYLDTSYTASIIHGVVLQNPKIFADLSPKSAKGELRIAHGIHCKPSRVDAPVEGQLQSMVTIPLLFYFKGRKTLDSHLIFFILYNDDEDVVLEFKTSCKFFSWWNKSFFGSHRYIPYASQPNAQHIPTSQ